MKRPFITAVAAALTLLSIVVSAAPAPDKWQLWDTMAAESTATIDHSLWQSVIDEYLQANPDNINRFAYAALAGNDEEPLSAYLTAMAAIDPRDYNGAEQQAYWINVYNALTVNLVLKYPNKKSILRMGERLFSVGPWDDEIYEVAGQALTLNDIEHRILRPIFQDHRVHYAVNCASIGCPNLAAVAFDSARLDAQLAAAEAAYINHPRGVSFSETGRLQLSQIYQWYVDDFAADEAALVQYLAARHSSLGDKLKQFVGKISYSYDWDLNKAQ